MLHYLKIVRRIVGGLLWTLLLTFFAIYILLHVPVVQAFIGEQASNMLSKKLGTKVSIGKVNLSEFGNILIDGFTLYDQQGNTLLNASKLSAGIDIYPLTQGRISVSSAQLFDMDARLYRNSASSKTNFQFVLDSLASKDTVSTPLDLHIASLVIRRGAVSYDQRDVPSTPGLFNTSHLKVNNLNAFVILPKLTDEEVDLIVKHLSAKEASGLNIANLDFRIKANQKEATLSGLNLKLPNSSLLCDEIKTSYSIKDGKIEAPSLLYKTDDIDINITPSDLAAFSPVLKHFGEPIEVQSSVDGTSSGLTVHQLSVNTDGANIDAAGYYNFSKDWNVNIAEARLSENFIGSIVKNLSRESISLPVEITRLGNVKLNGEVGGTEDILYTKSMVLTDAGQLDLHASYQPSNIIAEVKADKVKIGQILSDPSFGDVTADINIKGDPRHSLAVKGTANGNLMIARKNTSLDLDMDVTLAGLSFSQLNGDVNISKLQMSSPEKNYYAEGIKIHAVNTSDEHHLELTSNFADIRIDGIIDPITLPQSIANYVGRRISSLPGLPPLTNAKTNNFNIDATVYNTDILQEFFDIPLSIAEPLQLSATVNDNTSELSLNTSVHGFTYDGSNYRDALLDITTEDSIRISAAISKVGSSGQLLSLGLNAVATNNALNSHLSWDNNSSKHDKHIWGTLNSSSEFFRNENDKDAVHLRMHTSDVHVGDTVWTIQPSDIIYSEKSLLVDYFSIRHNYQHITIDGKATTNPDDSINVDLKDIDVSYILDLVDFHTVEFSGLASGKATLKGIFSTFDAHSDLVVNNFRFENGRLGILEAHVDWDNELGQIDIDALANDNSDRITDIDGYVSISQNFIDLKIRAENTLMEFLETYCSSFIANPNIYGTGNIRIFGDLSDVNLTGDIVANGTVDITTTGVTYTLLNTPVHAEPNEIYFLNDTILDVNGNKGIVTGALHHQSLTNLTFDVNVEAQHLLCYDFPDYNGASYYGTIYASGNCAIEGRPGRITFDIAGTPEQKSFIEYNAASPDAIRNSDFIVWRDKHEVERQRALEESSAATPPEVDSSTDIFLNFLVNIDQNFTLRLLMDESSHDYIALNGDGVIRSTFHNKGAFDMFGTYTIDHGIYKLTVQNVIKKDFQFQPGSTIVFGGDPYASALNMKAMYTVNGVSLSDLQIGNSFSSNNVRVDCMMNITGTPASPHVDFDFDLPTVNSDAKRMVRSLINSEEELNQQVIYLLSIGRFYAGSANNNQEQENAQQSQTTLAMQSLLSGTISQQINNVLSSWFNNNNWNFGANISTGDEGWNNAEYEGILSGRMFNNRLLINGQFGYRDNAKTATTSFIGDFDIRYLLFPNGNLAVKVYNQTNDRYFTKNSLNTQGIGIIIKHDF